MYKKNKKAISVECGYIKDKKSILNAKKSVIEFLKYYKFLDGKNIKTKKNYIKIVKLYKNKFGYFKKSREFKDFEKLNKKTLIGYDGNKKIFVDKGNLILFVRDRLNIGEECFLIGKNK